jgi:nucleoside-diphosphate-sugar epimerase
MFLVTGGAGFIGSHIVEALLERGAAVRVLDNFTGRRENLTPFADHLYRRQIGLRVGSECAMVRYQE